MQGPAFRSTPRRARGNSSAEYAYCAFASSFAGVSLSPQRSATYEVSSLCPQGRRLVHVSFASLSKRRSVPAPMPSELPAPSRQRPLSRRSFCQSAVAAVAAGLAVLGERRDAAAADGDVTPTTGFVTPSGLRYFDFVVGDGAKPKWGDFLTVEYAMYTISPEGDALVRADTTFGKDRTHFIHHGNGETILGLEEALHSMRVGGRRRVIIPPKMAFVNGRLGPIPPWAASRKRFFEKLEKTGGTVVFDVEIVKIEPYEDEFGYYSDETPSPEEAGAMLMKVQEKNRAAGI